MWPLYRTLLGLFYDNPDTYFREREVIESVDRPAELIRLQLWLVRAAGAVEEFQVEVRYQDEQAWYGLASEEGATPFERLSGGNDGTDLDQLLDRIVQAVPAEDIDR